MSISEKMTEILEFILNRATKYELELVGEALRKRMERESTLGTGQVDVRQMARSMAEGIEKQMGVDGDGIHEMTKRLVADMIRKEKPEISEAEVHKLVNHFVPGGKPREAPAAAVPRDMLLAMITQFVSYGTGGMSENEKKEFPDGWYEKYWNAFPSDIQNLVREYIHGRIGKDRFWKGIGESPAMKK
jgi:uncharacterized protein with HEPN domain